jgi:AcrR family transcriptional regulator
MDAAEPLPLRERKKALTRQSILTAADRLFERRGYDDVTVAEIADAANVSVKTLFVYFRSKEDLAFSDDWLIESILTALRERDPQASPASSVVDVMISALDEADNNLGIEGYHRAYGESQALQTGLLRVWAGYEDQVTAELASEHGGDASPADRMLAIQLVGIARLATSPEMRAALDGLSWAAAARKLTQLLKNAAAVFP